MKTFWFALLSSLAICFSSYTAEGRLVFAYDTSIALEGSNATFTCQDTERKLPFKVTWSFQGASVGRTLCENSSIAPGINLHKYQLLNSSTKLQVTDLNVNDTGNYTCRIKGEDGETVLSATATLYVKARAVTSAASNNIHPSASQLVGPSVTRSLARAVTSVASNNIHPSASQLVGHSVTRSLAGAVASIASNNIHPTPSPASNFSTVMKSTPLLPKSTEAAISGNKTCTSSFDNTVSFNERETSPSLIEVEEGDKLQLKCSYCVKSSKESSTLSWYKDGHVISRGIKNHNNVIGFPVVQHNKDEGLYKCVVSYKKQNISKLITVIVKKVESNPLLSSVFAQNKSFLSVQVTWRLTAHGVFTAARVARLKLRLLNSSEWSHQITNISQEDGLYKFNHLQPSSVYILNITLYNKDQQSESKTVVFSTAASNSSEYDQRLLLLYHVNNRTTLGVALGIMGLLAIMTITYACVMWCQSDKNGYSIPPGQQKRGVSDENVSLFARDTTSSLYYNKAFEDDKIDWMDDEIIS